MSASSPVSPSSVPSRARSALFVLLAVAALAVLAAGCEMRAGSDRQARPEASAPAAVPAPAGPAAAAALPGDPADVVTRLLSGVFADQAAESLAPLVDPKLMPTLQGILDTVRQSREQGGSTSLGQVAASAVRITASVDITATVTQDGQTREDNATIPLELVDGQWRVTSLDF